MPDVEAVLFDLYDTLVRSDSSRHTEFLAERLGVTPRDVVSAYDHLREERDGGELADAAQVLAAVVEYCGGEPDPRWIRRLVHLEADLLADHVGLYDDSLPVLRRLRSEGIRTGIISNCSPTTRPVVDGLGLPEEADVVILSCEFGERKPSPGIYRSALRALDIPAGRSLFVDDHPEYLDGAARLGIRGVLIVRDPARRQDPDGGDHPQVSDLAELLDLLD